MRPFLLFALVLGCAGCASEYDAPEPLHLARERDEMTAAIPPQSTPLQYMAWCALEEKALGDWADSQGSADSHRSEHLGKFADHPCYILWRQKP
jgi:hypothetical protein